MNSGFTCDRCGACCCTMPVYASSSDAEREPRISQESMELKDWLADAEWRYQLHPLPFHESCCFLNSSKLCVIYDSRPEVCRRFQAGSEQCQQARPAIGLAELSPDHHDQLLSEP